MECLGYIRGRGGVRTETVERRADEHEDVTLGAIEGGPVLVRELVRGDEHAQAADTNDHTPIQVHADRGIRRSQDLLPFSPRADSLLVARYFL